MLIPFIHWRDQRWERQLGMSFPNSTLLPFLDLLIALPSDFCSSFSLGYFIQVSFGLHFFLPPWDLYPAITSLLSWTYNCEHSKKNSFAPFFLSFKLLFFKEKFPFICSIHLSIHFNEALTEVITDLLIAKPGGLLSVFILLNLSEAFDTILLAIS